VIEARASATQTNINVNDAESFAKFQQSQGEISSALSRLMMTVEAYPDLKSNQNFLELQSQLEGTENRITVERKTFNETVKKLNTYIRQFPANIVANLFGFEQAQQFEAEE
jgi:LemA protein